MAKLVTEQTANDEAARVIFNLGCTQRLLYSENRIHKLLIVSPLYNRRKIKLCVTE